MQKFHIQGFGISSIEKTFKDFRSMVIGIRTYSYKNLYSKAIGNIIS